MRISDWSSDVCSSDLRSRAVGAGARPCFADQPGGADAVRKRAAPAVQGSGPRGVQPLFPPAVAWHVGAVRAVGLQPVGPVRLGEHERHRLCGDRGRDRTRQSVAAAFRERAARMGVALACVSAADADAARAASKTCFHSRRSEEHTSELQSLMRISYAVFCLTKKTKKQ